MLFFLEVNLETICLIIIEIQYSLLFQIMDSGVSLPGSSSISTIYYLCEFCNVFENEVIVVLPI